MMYVKRHEQMPRNDFKSRELTFRPEHICREHPTPRRSNLLALYLQPTCTLNQCHILHEKLLILRQVSVINNLNIMSTQIYSLACGDSQITWVG